MEVFYNHPCVASASGVTGVNLSQDRTEEEIDSDIKKQEEEEESCKWSQAPTLLLIASYKERQDRIDTGRLKKKKAFEEISQVLKEHQYPFTDAQCTSRMETLIRQYKTVKDNNNTSGSKRKSFIYENELDSLFKGSPSIRPEFVMSSATATHMSQSDGDGDELDDEGAVTRADNCKRKTEHIADEKDEDLCKICIDRTVNTVFGDCGHMICCITCCEMLNICPICRRENKSWIKVYKA